MRSEKGMALHMLVVTIIVMVILGAVIMALLVNRTPGLIGNDRYELETEYEEDTNLVEGEHNG